MVIFLVKVLMIYRVRDYSILIVELKRAKDKILNRYEECFIVKLKNVIENYYYNILHNIQELKSIA